MLHDHVVIFGLFCSRLRLDSLCGLEFRLNIVFFCLVNPFCFLIRKNFVAGWTGPGRALGAFFKMFNKSFKILIISCQLNCKICVCLIIYNKPPHRFQFFKNIFLTLRGSLLVCQHCLFRFPIKIFSFFIIRSNNLEIT